MRRIAILLLVTTTAVCQVSPEPYRYEVASIKPTADNDFRYSFQIEPDGTLAATGITLQRLMMTAYNVQNFRIAGGPEWVVSKHWDVQAKPNHAVPAGQVRDVLRALLEDRFRLRTHPETRTLPVYELTVDKKGAKFPKANVEEKHDIRTSPGSLEMTRTTTDTFASQLSYALGRPVVNKTNLRGEFNFTLHWTPGAGEENAPAVAPPDGPSIFTAIPEQLGLRLKSAHGPVEVIVIDQVQIPAAN